MKGAVCAGECKGMTPVGMCRRGVKIWQLQYVQEKDADTRTTGNMFWRRVWNL